MSKELDKIIKLEFYKKKKFWNLQREHAQSESTISTAVSVKEDISKPSLETTNNKDRLNEVSMISMPAQAEKDIQESSLETSPKDTKLTVTMRLKRLLECARQQGIAQEKFTEEDNDSSLEQPVLLYSQEDVVAMYYNNEEEKQVFGDSSSEQPVPLYSQEDVMAMYYNTEEENQVVGVSFSSDSGEKWNKHNIARTQFLEASGTFDDDSSIASFMRYAHGVPQSTKLDLTISTSAESLDSKKLASLTPGQLMASIYKHTTALRKLRKEASLRSIQWNTAVPQTHQWLDFGSDHCACD